MVGAKQDTGGKQCPLSVPAFLSQFCFSTIQRIWDCTSSSIARKYTWYARGLAGRAAVLAWPVGLHKRRQVGLASNLDLTFFIEG